MNKRNKALKFLAVNVGCDKKAGAADIGHYALITLPDLKIIFRKQCHEAGKLPQSSESLVKYSDAAEVISMLEYSVGDNGLDY